jgi:general secretion pathway protein B
MSFILDALKKSEDERQGATGPNLAYAPTGGRREGIPRWVLVLSVLLLVNLAGLVALMLWKQPAEETVVQPSPQQVTQAAPQQVTQAAPRQVTPPVTRNAPVYAAAKTIAEEPVSAPAQDKNGVTTVRSLAQEAQADMVENAEPSLSEPRGSEPAAIAESQAPAAAQQQEKASARVPSLNELLGEGKLMNLQSLSLDLHVYAARREDRFVFINLAKYLEGQTLKEGPRVEEITNDGVILRYQGERFLIPRS